MQINNPNDMRYVAIANEILKTHSGESCADLRGACMTVVGLIGQVTDQRERTAQMLERVARSLRSEDGFTEVAGGAVQ